MPRILLRLVQVYLLRWMAQLRDQQAIQRRNNELFILLIDLPISSKTNTVDIKALPIPLEESQSSSVITLTRPARYITITLHVP